MAEVVETKHRWDAGAGTTALGIIGTTLGGLATAMVSGKLHLEFLGSEINLGKEDFENIYLCIKSK